MLIVIGLSGYVKHQTYFCAMLLGDEYFMQAALREAEAALAADEVPVGAVIVSNGKIIARGHNQVERLNDVTAHAEMLAYTAAASNLGGKYLKECTLYVTVEPCPMCAAAAGWAQITRIVYGTPDPKKGYASSGKAPGVLHPATLVSGGILKYECAKLMIDFFRKRR